jgi:hypothetical protein
MTWPAIEVVEGEMLPRGYGLAWRRWDRHATVCLPLGLNIIAGVLRAIYQRIQRGINPTPFEKELAKARSEAGLVAWIRWEMEERAIHEHYREGARMYLDANTPAPNDDRDEKARLEVRRALAEQLLTWLGIKV